MSQVNTELGYSSTATISLNDTAVRSLAGVPSGTISMSDLWGKSAAAPAFNNSGEIGTSVSGSTGSYQQMFFNTDGTISYAGYNSLNANAPTAYCSPTGAGVGSGYQIYFNYQTFYQPYPTGVFQVETSWGGIVNPVYNSGWISLSSQRYINFPTTTVSPTTGYFQGTIYIRRSDGTGQIGRTWTMYFDLQGD